MKGLMGFLAGAVPECSVDCSVSSVFELSSQYATYHTVSLSISFLCAHLIKDVPFERKIGVPKSSKHILCPLVIVSIISTSRTAVP